MKRGVIKAFREYLNQESAERIKKAKGGSDSGRYQNFRYHQRVRLYGDYIYYQDRDMFMENLSRAMDGSTPECFPGWDREKWLEEVSS